MDAVQENRFIAEVPLQVQPFLVQHKGLCVTAIFCYQRYLLQLFTADWQVVAECREFSTIFNTFIQVQADMAFTQLS